MISDIETLAALIVAGLSFHVFVLYLCWKRKNDR